MSTDVGSITSGVKELNELWASVFELAVAVYLLNLQIWVACFVVIIPVVIKDVKSKRFPVSTQFSLNFYYM